MNTVWAIDQVAAWAKCFLTFNKVAGHDQNQFSLLVMLIWVWPRIASLNLNDPSPASVEAWQVTPDASWAYMDSFCVLDECFVDIHVTDPMFWLRAPLDFSNAA